MSVAIGTGLAIAGIGGSVASGVIGSRAAGKAGKTAAASADAATAEQRRQFDLTSQRQQPFIDDGMKALSQLNNLSADNFTADPGYQFRVAQGQKAIERSASAKGRAANPATDMALSRYNQNYASNEYSNVYNRLAQRAGIGQAAAGQMGVAGQNFANAAGNTMQNAGGARASGYANQGQILSNTATNVGDIFGNAYGLSKLRQQTPYGGPQMAGGGIDLFDPQWSN